MKEDESPPQQHIRKSWQDHQGHQEIEHVVLLSEVNLNIGKKMTNTSSSVLLESAQEMRTQEHSMRYTWLATPTGQLFVWQMRAITHPVAIIATEPNPYSSAPIAAAIRTSTPLLKPPSTLRITLSLSPFAISVCKRLWKSNRTYVSSENKKDYLPLFNSNLLNKPGLFLLVQVPKDHQRA